MTTTQSPTPKKYRPTDRRYSDKEWLYQQYWHDLETIESIAELTEVSATTIGRQLDENGIPRRNRHTTTEDHESLGNDLRGKYGCHSIEDDDDSLNWRRD
jgi:dihydroxyacetone kinase